MRVATPRDVASSTGRPRHVTTEIGVKLGAVVGQAQSARGIRVWRTRIGLLPCRKLDRTGRRTLDTNRLSLRDLTFVFDPRNVRSSSRRDTHPREQNS